MVVYGYVSYSLFVLFIWLQNKMKLILTLTKHEGEEGVEEEDDL